MPRSSGSSFKSSSRSSSSSTPTRSVSSVPSVPKYQPSPVAYTTPTLGQSMKEGFGLGVGASIARNVVDRAFGAFTSTTPTTSTTSTSSQISSHVPVQENTKLYEQCIENGATEEFCRKISNLKSE